MRIAWGPDFGFEAIRPHAPSPTKGSGQLDKALYDLGQTTIRAPADGYVGTLILNKGDRATPSKSVMSFILAGHFARKCGPIGNARHRWRA